jgi:hypothetical protein
MGILKKGCLTNSNCSAPNPDPSRYEVLEVRNFDNATLLKVRYIDCTNFEGVKILVYLGKFIPSQDLDPHFSETKTCPIARFKPDSLGYEIAVDLCDWLSK